MLKPLLSIAPLLCLLTTLGISQSSAALKPSLPIPKQSFDKAQEPSPDLVAPREIPHEDITDRLDMAGISDPQEVVNFLENLRSAAQALDRPALADLVHYPFTTYNRGTPVKTYYTPEELLIDFEKLFTPRVMRSIENVRYDNLFINSQGIMIGSGEIWFRNYPNGIKIKAINGQTFAIPVP
ncbi:MAG: hypothetical protein HC916_12025 [Coleofasciculaceae cyanobacterium SM2_1_6]|nr:hypothetical protein [Coleofasciculaceae cyanobacterium SM2_1_6]